MSIDIQVRRILHHARLLACALAMLAVGSTARAQPYGTLAPIYQFTGGADGAQPVGGLLRDVDGTFYGETSLGGTAACTSQFGNPAYGCGTIYSYTRTAGLHVLATFTGANGAHGQGTLTLAGSTLYGTTYAGGTNDLGTIFSIQTNGQNLKILHSFTGTDGDYPIVKLVIGSSGTLYGTTQFGGTAGAGVLFSLAADGTYAVLHTFTNGLDGGQPFSLILTRSGTLLGSTFVGGGTSRFCSSGCGTLFEYNPASRQFTNPYSYTTGGGSGGVIGGIAPGQTVYGASTYILYTISPTAGYVEHGEFDVLNQGVIDSAPFLLSDGSFLGVNGPGPNQSVGTIYSAKNNVILVRSVFGGQAGAYPFSQPLLMPGNVLVGTATEQGKCSYCGTIWISNPP